MKLIKPSARIVDKINGKEIIEKIENCGRVCYKSEDKITDFENSCKFVAGLIKSGHESVLEHVSISVRFICDRGVSHELVRHRLASFSQESTRYVTYRCGCQFIIPHWIKAPLGDYVLDESQAIIQYRPFDWQSVSFDNYENLYIEKCKTFDTDNIICDTGWYEIDMDDDADDGETTIVWLLAMLRSEGSYLDLLELGWSPQQARSVLPNSTKTELITTANIREWRHILKQRTSKRAHPQMREVMLMLLEEFKKQIPVVFDDITGE